MHNGVVAHFTDIRRDLCDLMDNDAFEGVTGSTDSEHVAALYMTLLAKGAGHAGKVAWEKEYTEEAMAAALILAVQKVLELQQKTKGRDMKPSSLNLAVTDGRKMVAIRFRNVDMEEPRELRMCNGRKTRQLTVFAASLYYSETAGVTLNRKFPGHPNSAEESAKYKGHVEAEKHGKHVIISSEPTTFDENEWSLIPRNTLVLVDAQGNLRITPAMIDDTFIVKDPDAK